MYKPKPYILGKLIPRINQRDFSRYYEDVILYHEASGKLFVALRMVDSKALCVEVKDFHSEEEYDTYTFPLDELRVILPLPIYSQLSGIICGLYVDRTPCRGVCATSDQPEYMQRVVSGNTESYNTALSTVLGDGFLLVNNRLTQNKTVLQYRNINIGFVIEVPDGKPELHVLEQYIPDVTELKSIGAYDVKKIQLN